MDMLDKKIVISGYYGFGNSGDEAVLHSILLALRQQGEKQGLRINPVVLSIDPASTERMHGVKALHRLKPSHILQALRGSHGLISGGGSLLQDATGLRTIPYYLGIIKLAQLLGKPTFIYSQGMGPILRKSFHPLIRNAFNRSEYVSVRDAESLNFLQSVGVRQGHIDIVSDPVLGLPLQPSRRNAASSGMEPVIGISVRFWHRQRYDLNQVTEALRELLDLRPVRLRFLPFHLPADVEASKYVISRLGTDYAARIHLVEHATYPQEMLEQVGACDLLIGMRLHSLIYAASYLIPMVGISYDPKIDHFMQRLQMKPVGTTERLEPRHIVNEALQLLDHQDEWIQAKQQMIASLKLKSQKPAQHICHFLRNKG